MNLEYRQCRPEDSLNAISFFKDIADQTFFTNQFVGGEPSPLELEQVWGAALDSDVQFFIGVFDSGRLIGNISYRIIRPGHPWLRYTMTFGMFILKEYWGRGIGQALLGEMETFASKNSIKRIEATVRVENERGLKFYKKQSFVIEGTRKYAALIDGVWKDEYAIAKYY